jgi:SNF2 family DNA or RNA helicase
MTDNKPPHFKHQAEEMQYWQEPARALWWEQGCAKTRPTIETGVMLLMNNLVEAMIVVAPPGVERNWASDELPAWLPSGYNVNLLLYRSEKSSTRWHQQQIARFLDPDDTRPRILLMSYDAVMTERRPGKTKKGDMKGYEVLKTLLTRYRAYYVLDEGHYIKNPGAKRTKRILASAPYAPYRRILTGTPIAQGPFDLYAQARFIDPDIWKKRGIGDFNVFKRRYGEWLTAAEVREQAGYDPGYDQLLGYRNLHELEDVLAMLGSRHTKDEVLDLPPKLYRRAWYELTAEQQKVYDELKENFFTELPDGTLVTAELPIVRLLRYHQVCCGYLPTGDEDDLHMFKKNPRLDRLGQELDGLYHPAIIWTRFRKDVDLIMEMAKSKKMEAVRYDGSLSPDECEKSKLAFQSKDGPQLFVSTIQKGATGLTLVRARTVFYHSNSFRFVDRLQSEDRAHRPGQEHPVEYVDFAAHDTVDIHIIKNLIAKHDIAARLTGDQLKEWIR